jgi:DNA segregation ATPase FtsK/SpoIIIE, S-DNA-T family
VATRYGSGPDDVTLRSALEGLRALRKECDRRAAMIRELDREHCPEFKVTSAVANTPGLHPLVVAIDEAQSLFQDKQYGKEAGELAEQVIKLGRALGIILIIATQRPDRDSLPTGVAANVGTRLCLRVMDQVANDVILGTSSYQRGIRATLFTHVTEEWATSSASTTCLRSFGSTTSALRPRKALSTVPSHCAGGSRKAEPRFWPII